MRRKKVTGYEAKITALDINLASWLDVLVWLAKQSKRDRTITFSY